MIEDMVNSIGEKEILDWIHGDYKNRIGWGFTAERDDLGNWRTSTFANGEIRDLAMCLVEILTQSEELRNVIFGAAEICREREKLEQELKSGGEA